MRRDLCQHGRRSFLSSRTWTFVTIYFASMMVVSVDSMRDLIGHIPIPEFLPGLLDVSARPGGNAILPCSVRHLGTKQVVWRDIRKDQFLTIGPMAWSGNPNVSIDFKRRPDNVTDWNLVISDVTLADAGTYECQVTSRAGHHKHVTLSVIGPPITKPVISITGKKWVDLGQKITLRCNASGGVRVPDEIDWFKSGDKIDSEKYRRIVIDKYKSMADRSFISDLVIDRSSLNDTGDYICRSSRNDIANLKVTVLHGVGSEPNKRGTDHGGRNRHTLEEYNGCKSHTRSSGAVLQAFLLCLFSLLSVQVTTLRATPFGLFS